MGFLVASSAQTPGSITNPLTGFTGNSQANFPNQPVTLAGSGLNVSFIWTGGAGAWERIAFGASGATFGGNSPAGSGAHAGRNYLRTDTVNFANSSFRAYVTVNRVTRQAVYFGIGAGALGEWKQPDVKTGNASVLIELQEGFDNASRRINGGTFTTPTNVQVGYEGMTTVTGLMRLRMDYNSIFKTVDYAIDYNPSGAFVPDQTFPQVDVSSIASEWAAGENSRIFFGGQRNVVFSDFVVDTSGLPFAGEIGKMTREVWNNIPGPALTSFTGSPRYYQAADSVTAVSGASVPQNIGQDFASRIRGYITAPVTGAYTFWIASDDHSELRLSSDSSKFNRIKIASLSLAVDPLEWDRLPSQKSGLIELVAGQKYFIEALHKEGFGLDHLAVAWQTPGGTRELIPASALESFTADANDLDGDELLDSWELAHGFAIAPMNTVPSGQLPTADPDQDGYTNLEESMNGTDPGVHGGVPGALLLETWNGITGSSVNALTRHSKFAVAADQSEYVFTAEIPANRGDNYGVRMRGYVVPPATGNYTFHIAGDDNCELWLSPSPSQFGKQKIAVVRGWTGIRQWNVVPTQTSAPVALVAGQKYYLEALMKESNGSDHLSVAWKTPGSSIINIIPSSALEAYAYDLQDPDGDNMPSAWEAANGLNPSLDDAALDPDLDTIDNLREFLAGTNPQVKATQGLAMEFWTDMPYYSTRAMVQDTKFYGPPQQASLLEGAFTGEQTDPNVYFATRARGYLVAPETGPYRFWVSGRNGVELYLSTNGTKYSKRLIAEINPEMGGGHGIAFNDINQWDQFSSQQSAIIHLEEGQSYFLEALQVNGHAPGAHLSLAWAPPGGAREPIPVNNLLPYETEVADADDDSLPDAWESQHGLDPLDNGWTDLARQGERGDFDGDGLDNRAEFLLGTNPTNADTDGDGASDYAEAKQFNTSPLVSDAILGSIVNSPTLASYNPSGTSGTWQVFDGGLIGSSFRGRIEWSFTVPSDGWWIIDLSGRLRGDLRQSEDLALGVSIDSKPLAEHIIHFSNGQPANLRVLSPFLQAGTHTFSVDIRNEMGRRSFQLLALNVLGAGGFDGDNNGRPDWLDLMLNRDNQLSPVASESFVSPLFIEGSVRHLGGAEVSSSTLPVTALRGLGDLHWFANVPLNQAGGTSIGVSLETRHQTQTVTWTRWNAMAGQALTIRVGDSVKIGGWLTLEDEGTATITVNGQTTPVAASGSFVQTFSQVGTYPVTVSHSGGTQTTASIHVVAASFGTPATFYSDKLIWRSFPGVPATLKIASDPTLAVDTTLPEGTGQKAQLRPFRAGPHTLAARLPNGPIVALGNVTFIGVSDALKNDATVSVGFTADGYQIIRTPIVVTNLPAGGRVVLTIFRAGVTFMDGTTVKTLNASDFVEDVAYVDFRFPPNLTGGYCHYIDVYDSENRHLGRR